MNFSSSCAKKNKKASKRMSLSEEQEHRRVPFLKRMESITHHSIESGAFSALARILSGLAQHHGSRYEPLPRKTGNLLVNGELFLVETSSAGGHTKPAKPTHDL